MSTSAFSAAALADIADYLGETGSVLDPADLGIYVHLWTNNVTPDANSTLASLGESANTGYAPVFIFSPGWAVANNSSGQNTNYPGALATFVFATPSSPTSETIFGWSITQAVGVGSSVHDSGVPVYSKSLNVPVLVNQTNQVIQIACEVSLSNDCGGS